MAPVISGTPFDDLDTYVALPRLSGLTLSPDGERLVTVVATPNAAGTGYATALWQVDPRGVQAATRLTRSAKGESGASFGADGDLWFTSARPGPEEPTGTRQGGPEPALWRLPSAGGEAGMVLSRPGGVDAVTCARAADRVVVTAGQLPGATDEQRHAALHEQRRDAGVDAILHQGYPVRYWDSDLGPAAPQLFVVQSEPDAAEQTTPVTVDHEEPLRLRLVTAGVGNRLEAEPSVHLAPDGSFALVALVRPEARAEQRTAVMRIDLATGAGTVLLDVEGMELWPGPVSPDGRRAVVTCEEKSTPESAPQPVLHLLDLEGGALAPLAPGWDRWADPVEWTPDGAGVLVLADEDGRRPLFRIDARSGEVTRLTHDDAAYSDVVLAPDGAAAYALRSSYAFPAEVVRIELSPAGTGQVTALPGPIPRPELPGRLTEVETTTDGVRVRAWLALPHDSAAEDPAPLLLWIHGGPLGSWNAWSWRWNPWLLVAQGYAVLLPDPALSTGYGQEFIQRGWGAWGGAPYEDLMAITDAAVARPDIDETRTAAMGGSFGGYMANWVAGHTDRFDAIVTHASLWSLEGFGPTTDAAWFWSREMTREMTTANSPHAFVDRIVTPMLVIHGDRDYRVPIGEGLRLWYELLSSSGRPAAADGSTDHRFLYFPAENHWVLSPQHAKVWYQVVIGFLARHVLGQDPGELPAVLGGDRQ